MALTVAGTSMAVAAQRSLPCHGHPAVASVIESDRLLENVQRMGAILRSRLASTLSDQPHVGDIRGRGLFIGIELVIDREARTPPPAALGLPVS